MLDLFALFSTGNFEFFKIGKGNNIEVLLVLVPLMFITFVSSWLLLTSPTLVCLFEIFVPVVVLPIVLLVI